MRSRIDVYPATLNFGSKGTWITGYIQLYKGVNVNNITVSSLLLNSTVPTRADLTGPVTLGDYDSDGAREELSTHLFLCLKRG